MTPNSRPEARRRPRTRLLWKVGIAVLCVMLVLFLFRRGGEVHSSGTTFEVRRGDLIINVLEGGSVEARESQTIKSEVSGQTKILSIVDEGYLVTEEDVANGKILVTLDSSELREKLTQEEIQYQSAWAAYTEAREQFEIQIKQNESDITSSELEAKFARMDFEKYLGAEATSAILIRLDLYEIPSFAPTGGADAYDLPASDEETESNEELADAALPETPETGEVAPDKDPGNGMAILLETLEGPPRPAIDFTEYATPDRLGDGEAQQKLRTARSDRFLAEEELKLAETTFEGTQRLKEKNFVTQQELERDRMTVERNRNSAEAARISEDLFIKYEFPKQAEKLLSDYEEAIRKLERTYKQAVSKLAQAEAKMKSNEAKYNLQKARRDELAEQIDKCTIRAERPGLVVYAGSDDPWRRRGDPIEEGATVYERQEIITIPDMTQMAVNVKVHESAVREVEKGQKADVHFDAHPDQTLTGEVIKVSVLPDSSRRWMNPDLKLYPAEVSIDGVHGWLKPGMSAEVEILVRELKDVLYVPIQAVSSSEGERVCYVDNGIGSPERRVVETGGFNDEYIEIARGLEEGDVVLLRAPERKPDIEEGGAGKERPEEQDEPTKERPEGPGRRERPQKV